MIEARTDEQTSEKENEQKKIKCEQKISLEIECVMVYESAADGAFTMTMNIIVVVYGGHPFAFTICLQTAAIYGEQCA